MPPTAAPESAPSRPSLLEAMRERLLVLDGAMGTQVHAIDLDLEKDYLGCENCTDVLSLSRPDAIAGIHRAYFDAGSDAVTTNSFGGARHVLEEFGLEGRTFELNRSAAAIARGVADGVATPDRPRFVLGSLGPGTKLITLGQIGWDRLYAAYREAAEGLVARICCRSSARCRQRGRRSGCRPGTP